MSILVKDFTNRQALAWKFFDELEEDKEQGFRRIDADAQTFTILLQGIKKYTDVERNTLMKDKNIGKNPRLLLLMDLEAGHIKIAQLVMDRAKQLATPPKKLEMKKLMKRQLGIGIEQNWKLICHWFLCTSIR